MRWIFTSLFVFVISCFSLLIKPFYYKNVLNNKNINIENYQKIKLLELPMSETIIPLGFTSDAKKILGVKISIGSDLYSLEDISQVPFVVYQLNNGKSELIEGNIDQLKKLDINGDFLISIKNKETETIDIYALELDNGELLRYECLSFNTNANDIFGAYSPNRQKIYFSSDMLGGYGGYDIYEVEHLGAGKWSTPRNLGPNVNTSGHEIAPFIMSDGLTLFFSRKPSLNNDNYDIYVSTIMDDGTIEVADIIDTNINTNGDDIFIRISPNNNKAVYVTKMKNSWCFYEINFHQ